MNAPSAEKNRRVLVIDDNRSIHDDFRKILGPATGSVAALDATEAALFGGGQNLLPQMQFVVDSAYQGQEGVLRAAEALEAGRPYALVFVDVRMPPGWDGVETTRKLWELDPNIQVVLCTAYSDYSWGEMVEQLGHRDGLLILKKPFDTVEALQLAHALTEKWWLHLLARRKMDDLESRVAERTQELASSLSMLNATFESTADGIVAVDLAGSVVSYNTKFAAIWQLPGGTVGRRPASEMRAYVSEQVKDSTRFLRRTEALQAEPETESFDVIELKDGRTFERYVFPHRIDGQCVGSVINWRDITARKRVEAQLFQSQKMETVGKLAGGIAHEFNSILTAIIGQSELILGDLPPGHALSQNAASIHQAAERAATLTRQLLAYGRGTILRPELLDLNRVVAGMENTIRHVMGSAVDVRIFPAEGLHGVKADAGQIEQVIMNLVMNASEAMPNGGKLTLETGNLSCHPESLGRYPNLKPGDYATLAITDTGAGMSDEVKARAFEPFYTTKDVGQGTGLGLSTGYGIIKQSGGHLSVYSEPGRGSTFKVYLPQAEPQTKTSLQRMVSPDLPRGTETILLVEDDPALREMAASLLGRLGYTVLAAANGVEALSLRQQRSTGHIDLLFTDVVMPHMSGGELADRLRSISPHTRILFTSAYAQNAVVHQGALNQGVALLQKPFTPSALAHRLREALDQPAEPSSDAAR
jgi:two-component system, cell cycle sensor histidine kinase and response regulator CckA